MSAAPRPDGLKRVIQAIQATRRQVAGLADDETWRAWLAKRPGGVTSLREMEGRQLGAVLDDLHKAGALRRTADQHGRRRYVDDQQMKMIRGLWIELHKAGKVRNPSEEALGAFVRRQTRQDMGALSPAAAAAVIEALKRMKARPTRGRAA